MKIGSLYDYIKKNSFSVLLTPSKADDILSSNQSQNSLLLCILRVLFFVQGVLIIQNVLSFPEFCLRKIIRESMQPYAFFLKLDSTTIFLRLRLKNSWNDRVIYIQHIPAQLPCGSLYKLVLQGHLGKRPASFAVLRQQNIQKQRVLTLV